MHHTICVEHEDTVANRLENDRRLLTLCRRCLRCSLGCLEPSPLPLESCVPYCRRHLSNERLEQLYFFAVVLAKIPHQLHDSDDVTVMLDRHHHR